MPITKARTSPPCGGRIAASAGAHGANIRPKTATGASVNADNNVERKNEPAPLNEMLIALPLTCACCDGARAAPLPPCPPPLADEGKVGTSAARLCFQPTCRHWMTPRQPTSGLAKR